MSFRPKGTWWGRGKDGPVEGKGQKQRDCQSLTVRALEAPLLHLSGLFLLCQNPVSINDLPQLQLKSASQQKYMI